MTDRLIAWFFDERSNAPPKTSFPGLSASARRRFEEHVLDATGGIAFGGAKSAAG